MKRLIALALFSAVVAAPAFADDAAAKATDKKPAAAAPAQHKHSHKMPGMKKDDCDTKHRMGGEGKMDDCDTRHRMGGHDMMGDCDTKHHMGEHMMEGQDADMMMEPGMPMLGMLDLSAEQKSRISQLSDELKHNNWATQGLINDESAKLRDLYAADKRDPAAIGKEYQKIFDLKRQMIEAFLNTQNRIEEVLTPEQLAKMKEARHMMDHKHGHHMQ